MRIGIDIRVLARGTRTGVEEYVINLLSHLLPLDQKTDYLLFYNAWRKERIAHCWTELANVFLRDARIPNRALFLSTRYLSRPRFDKILGGADVYFNPHFFTAPVSRSCRKIVTFHDLSFLRFAHCFSWRKRIWQKFFVDAKKEARSADKIIAVSQSTKSDLVNLYGLAPEKIEVIYSGLDDRFLSLGPHPRPGCNPRETREKYRLPDSFILYFGTIEPRKNLISLINGYELLRDRRPELAHLKLVFAGALGWLYADILKAARRSRYGQDIVFTGFVADEDKPSLYRLAELFVYPSFFEGFGFPPLEAMACDVPTIVSNSSSLPEVVGAAGLMVDAANIDELSHAMEAALMDQGLRRRLVSRGREQAKMFSWKDCAKKTLGVLKAV